MTILDTLMPKRRGPVPLIPDPPKAPTIQAKIDAIQADLAAVDEQIGQAALRVEFELDGADVELADLKKRRAGLEARLADLTAAHSAAVEVDRAALQRSRTAMFKHEIGKVKKRLAERDAQAQRLTAAIAECVDAWQSMWVANRKARRALPNGAGVWPDEVFSTDVKLGRAVMGELWRLSGHHPLQAIDDEHPPAFGFMKPPNGSIDAAPVNYKSLVDEIARSTRYITDTLEGTTPNWSDFQRGASSSAAELDHQREAHEEATARAEQRRAAETDPEHS
jgi:hypothetical protein